MRCGTASCLAFCYVNIRDRVLPDLMVATTRQTRTFLEQLLLVFLWDLAVMLFKNRIRANVHTVVLLGKYKNDDEVNDYSI